MHIQASKKISIINTIKIQDGKIESFEVAPTNNLIAIKVNNNNELYVYDIKNSKTPIKSFSGKIGKYKFSPKKNIMALVVDNIVELHNTAHGKINAIKKIPGNEFKFNHNGNIIAIKSEKKNYQLYDLTNGVTPLLSRPFKKIQDVEFCPSGNYVYVLKENKKLELYNLKNLQNPIFTKANVKSFVMHPKGDFFALFSQENSCYYSFEEPPILQIYELHETGIKPVRKKPLSNTKTCKFSPKGNMVAILFSYLNHTELKIYKLKKGSIFAPQKTFKYVKDYTWSSDESVLAIRHDYINVSLRYSDSDFYLSMGGLLQLYSTTETFNPLLAEEIENVQKMFFRPHNSMQSNNIKNKNIIGYQLYDPDATFALYNVKTRKTLLVLHNVIPKFSKNGKYLFVASGNTLTTYTFPTDNKKQIVEDLTDRIGFVKNFITEDKSDIIKTKILQLKNDKKIKTTAALLGFK